NADVCLVMIISPRADVRNWYDRLPPVPYCGLFLNQSSKSLRRLAREFLGCALAGAPRSLRLSLADAGGFAGSPYERVNRHNAGISDRRAPARVPAAASAKIPKTPLDGRSVCRHRGS